MDYVEAMWMMLQQEKADDFVVATGETHAVREFVELAFGVIDRKITWAGTGVDETGTDQNGNVLVRVDPKYFRPTEVDLLMGDPTKAEKQLGWKNKITLEEMSHLKRRRVLSEESPLKRQLRVAKGGPMQA